MNIITSLTKLSISAVFTRSIYTNTSLYFKSTPYLLAEPLKKKKRLDPSVVKAREERKKKKIEKQIRKLEKSSRQLKPIEELEVPLCLTENIKNRIRSNAPTSSEVMEKRHLLLKEWSRYKYKQHLEDTQMLDRIIYSQQRALDELRNESEELYQEAIQVDFKLLPYKSEGPVITPKVDDYNSPDGDYQDLNKTWE